MLFFSSLKVGGTFTAAVMPHMAFGGRVAVCGAISGYNKQEEEEEGAMTGRRWDPQILLYILRIVLEKTAHKLRVCVWLGWGGGGYVLVSYFDAKKICFR